jgi:mannose-1-phosphate guanylyltransferase/mannose-6-phosphate isomerase
MLPAMVDKPSDPPGPPALIHPVIMSGGAGTRLWPLSRVLVPKQLLSLDAHRTMIQETAARVTGVGFAPPTIICNRAHRFAIASQLREIGVQPREIVLETEGRNTAAAAAIAALVIAERNPADLVLLLPSDHVVRNVTAFHDAILRAAIAAEQGMLVTFGAEPTAAATGYGYIQGGEALPDAPGCFAVAGFKEKPDSATAQLYLAAGNHLWNIGIFLFRADSFLAELEWFEPGIVAACRQSLARSRFELGFRLLDANALRSCKSISLDYAVMERTTKAAVVPTEIGWSDVGSWDALWELGAKDGDGNVTAGDVMLEDVRNSYVRSDSHLVTVLGVDDLVVVTTADATLIAHRNRAQGVKQVVERLQRQGRRERLEHNRLDQPWGTQEIVDAGDRFQVMRLVVVPGAELSLQHHRAQHWVVVQGAARLTTGDDTMLVGENESIFVRPGSIHRLENPGAIPLIVIEVHSGPQLREGRSAQSAEAHESKPLEFIPAA